MFVEESELKGYDIFGVVTETALQLDWYIAFRDSPLLDGVITGTRKFIETVFQKKNTLAKANSDSFKNLFDVTEETDWIITVIPMRNDGVILGSPQFIKNISEKKYSIKKFTIMGIPR